MTSVIRADGTDIVIPPLKTARKSSKGWWCVKEKGSVAEMRRAPRKGRELLDVFELDGNLEEEG